MSDLVELDRYPDAALANIVRGRLEAAGIAAFCFDEGMNLAESVPMIFRVRVMVLADDLDEARRVVMEAVSPDDDPTLLPEEWAEDSPGRDTRRRRLLRVGLALVILPPMLVVLLLAFARSN
jgi:hypothetical protein